MEDNKQQQQLIRKRLSEPNTYTTRYVAFLDMLGFSNMCANREKNCAEIKAIFNDIELLKMNFDRFAQLIIPDEIRDDTEFTFMSDSIIISAPSNEAGLLFILYLSSCIQNLLLLNGILLRGGIAEGDFYKHENIMFGPVLITAYSLESKTAKYPRVILSEDITTKLQTQGLFKKKSLDDYLAKYKGKGYNTENTDDSDSVFTQIGLLLKQDAEDSFIFVNQFNPIEMLSFSKEKKARIDAVIQGGLSNKDESIKAKYQWLEKHLNDSCHPLKSPFNNLTSADYDHVRTFIHDIL